MFRNAHFPRNQKGGERFPDGIEFAWFHGEWENCIWSVAFSHRTEQPEFQPFPVHAGDAKSFLEMPRATPRQCAFDLLQAAQ